MSSAGVGAHVLLVDDEVGTLLLARRSLERAGYSVTTAVSPEKARVELSSRVPDLLIVDYSLNTVETGLDFFRTVRQSGLPIPSILLTGFTNESRIIEALRAGVADVVPKTTDYLDYLPEAVERVLSTQRLQRKIAETERFQAREKFYREIAEAIPHLVWTTTPDGHYDYLSRQWVEYAGVPQGNPSAFEWINHIAHPEDRAASAEAAERALSGQGEYDIEHRLRSAGSGAYRWFRSRGLPLRDDRGDIVKWFGTSTDIENQKQAQAERESLLQRERLARAQAEHAARMKEEFVATLSHELRTPLNAIAGWAQLLRRESCTDPQTRKKGLEVIDRNARLQAQMVDDLLDMSRILAGNLRLEIQSVDLRILLEEVKSTLQPASEAKRIHIEIDTGNATPILQADPSRLQQIIWNLLTNAIKFTQAGGHVRIEAKADEQAVTLAITDNGRGISAAFLPYVFDRFRQEDGSATRRVGGLGLGLSIVKQLTELHGGSIDVSSPGEGEGTTFTLCFPQRMSPAVSALNPRREIHSSAASAALSDKVVLVIDDEPDACELLRIVLENSGARVHVAIAASEALRLFDAHRPALLVSDISMPGIDGCELMRRIRLMERRSGNVPVIAVALSALARPEDRRRAIAAGFEAHIAKPADPLELVQRLAALAGGLRSNAA